MAPVRMDEQRFRAVLETAVDGIILIDQRGLVLAINPACERLFGYAAEELRGQNVKTLMPEPYRAEHDGYIENYRRTGKAKIIGIGREVVGRRKDGSTFPMYLSVGEAKEGDVSTFVGIVHDLTETKRAEEQLIQAQKMEAVGHLSGGIAHDFNNLLTVMIGTAEMLIDELDGQPDRKRMAGVIVAAGERGAALTRRLLAFGRRQTLRPAETDVNALLDDSLTMLRRTLPEDVVINLRLAQGLPRGFVDPSQLEAAVLNLCINARDAMPDGGTITVTTSRSELDEDYRLAHPEVPPGAYIAISVTDDGTGMTPEILEHVFEPFFTTKEVGKGSGLGLSMVYGFVKQSGGHVNIYSEVGLGTTVRVYLPCAGAEEAIEAALAPAAHAPAREGEVILFVEDDPFVQAFGAACLESLGYRTVSVSSGNEALEVLEAGHPFDLLLTDVVMPGGMSGWELVEKAKVLRPGMKMLVASGYATEALAQRRGMDASIRLIEKPFRKAILGRMIRDALDN